MTQDPMPGLGRRVPSDWKHVIKYPIRSLLPRTVQAVEKTLYVPARSWLTFYNQGSEGACVGFGSSQCMSILNSAGSDEHLYDARWLWNAAKQIDEWPDTNPGDDNGTSVRAAMDVLRTQGHVREIEQIDRTVDPNEGITENRWATTVDEVRTCIGAGVPVVLGVNWYSLFDSPERGDGGEFWIPKNRDLGSIRGGHCICLIAASDERQAVQFPNSWGLDYPTTWLSYDILQRLLSEEGEATLVTDKISPH